MSDRGGFGSCPPSQRWSAIQGGKKIGRPRTWIIGERKRGGGAYSLGMRKLGADAFGERLREGLVTVIVPQTTVTEIHSQALNRRIPLENAELLFPYHGGM